jgi:hypothetical protein
MHPLDPEIATAFGQGERPLETELVIRDGFDELDKDDAVRFFSGKTWADVLAHLRALKDAPVFRGAYHHEEWSVLSPQSLAYYARAYLECLHETLAAPQPDEEFVFYFLGALHQVFYMHKGSPFDPVQTNALRGIVERVRDKAAALESFDYFVEDIRLQAEQVLTGMDDSGGNRR